MALVLAIASSRTNIPLANGLAACGEVGLGGEVRAVAQIEPRLKELSKMGFTKVLVPKANLSGTMPDLGKLQAVSVSSLEEALLAAGLVEERKKGKKSPEVEDF